jgi:hypothetical protein
MTPEQNPLGVFTVAEWGRHRTETGGATMNITFQELSTLWSKHFDSEFPYTSVSFFRSYDISIVDEALAITAKRATKRPFNNMAHAVRSASAVMASLKRMKQLANTPAPTPKPIPETAEQVSKRQARRVRFINKHPQFVGKTNAEIDAAIQATIKAESDKGLPWLFAEGKGAAVGK